MSVSTQQSNLQRVMRARPAKVISICSGKGGVGKTNVACNIATALGQVGHDTCLLDADLSLANVDVLLGLSPRFNLSHVVNGEVGSRSHDPARAHQRQSRTGRVRQLLHDGAASGRTGRHYPGIQ